MKPTINLLLLSLFTACTGEKSAEICDDGKDNDGNELADCEDNACSEDAACVDADGDGSPASLDCDDNEPLAYPDATETCDEIDNNCDGVVDEGLTSTYYADADGDAFGDAANTIEACTVPSGYVADSTDCDDSSSDSYPSAPEVCDGLDNDCNDVIDDDPEDPVVFYQDGDGDGYGLDNNVEAWRHSGYADKGGDCDDADTLSYPGADEVCDGVDNDCDTDVDEEPVDGDTYYADADGDGFGDLATQTTFCDPVSGYVSNGDDCDDTTVDANPDAPEICDGIDNDCDNDIDDADANVISASQTTWYLDGDGDGYGVDSSTLDACVQPSGYAEFDGDCDDNRTRGLPWWSRGLRWHRQ